MLTIRGRTTWPSGRNRRPQRHLCQRRRLEQRRRPDTLNQILNEKPDLVIWEYGANDSQNNRMPGYIKNTQAAIDKLKAAGVEVALHTVTPSATIDPGGLLRQESLVQIVAKANIEIRKLAKANDCAIADMERAFDGPRHLVRRRPLLRLHPPQPHGTTR